MRNCRVCLLRLLNRTLLWKIIGTLRAQKQRHAEKQMCADVCRGYRVPIILQLNSLVINADQFRSLVLTRSHGPRARSSGSDRKPIFTRVTVGPFLLEGTRRVFPGGWRTGTLDMPSAPWCTSPSPQKSVPPECLFVRDLSLICVCSKGRICVLVPSNGILCASVRLSAAIRVRSYVTRRTHPHSLVTCQVRKIASWRVLKILVQ